MTQIQVRNQSIEKQDIDFLLLLGYNYLKSNKPNKAIVVYKALHHLYPNSAIFCLCLSYLYLKNSEYDEALSYAEKYLRKTKGSLKQGHLIKSRALYELGMIDEAKRCARQVLIQS